MDPNPLRHDPDEIADVAAIVDARWPDPERARPGEPTLTLGLSRAGSGLFKEEGRRLEVLRPLRRRLFDRFWDESVLIADGFEGSILQSVEALTDQPADTDPYRALASLAIGCREDVCLLAPPEYPQPACEGGERLGRDVLIGGAVAFPSRWRLAEKLGRPMAEIHDPVPGLNARLGRPVDRLFATLAPGRPVRRSNWLISDDPQIDQRVSRIAPPISAKRALEDLFVRTETQTLVRLWSGGPLAFLILVRQVVLGPVLDRVSDGHRRLSEALDGLTPEMAGYKSLTEHLPGLRVALTRGST